MKTFILALDALGYDLVDEGNFPNLKQVEYGKMDLSVFPRLFTPIIWASFITGKSPEEHGVKSFVRWRNPILNLLQAHMGKKPKKYGRVLRKIGFKSRNVSRKDLKHKTIFDYARKPIVISIPSYNEWESIHDIRSAITEAIWNETMTEEIIRKSRVIYREKVEKVIEAVIGEWDIFMVHIALIDTFGHLKYNSGEEYLELYAVMDCLVERIKRQLNGEFWFLIVSDHGMHEGKHTRNALYSSNIAMGFNNLTFKDFFNKVVQIAAGRDLEKEQEIVKRLTELGYVE